MTFRTRIYRVELPLTKAILVKGGQSASRSILRVECEAPNGQLIWADCAPLPGFHRETLEECALAAQDYFASFKQWSFSVPLSFQGTSADSDLSAGSLPISLRTSVEILKWAAVLPEPKPVIDMFENSAVLRIPEWADFDSTIESVTGARVCKVKLAATDSKRAREFLVQLVNARSDRELRIDCNQDLQAMDVKGLSHLIRGLPLAYVEEPCSSPLILKSFAKALPIALDESLGLDSELDGLAKAWVIKPNCLGWTETLRRFSDPGPQLKVLSNVWESLETLQLYAWAYRQSVTKPEACGLGTAFYMADDPSPLGWNCKTYTGPWPKTPLSPRIRDHHEVLLWES